MVVHEPVDAWTGMYRSFHTGVAGGAAAGKTAVCDMIIEQLHDQRVVVVNQEEEALREKREKALEEEGEARES
ncbi:hypothetical protein C4D60_Mb08t33860 [Musa balbisiana]|uniref:Uncharacterized protein n=1 Tax=Musa balbisiana TaxID=52838 RepID=A0A4S8K8K2_MUSBA|nr:hypothetical protein C4D60_Mb08t33860 [Musa balbisiana]